MTQKRCENIVNMRQSVATCYIHLYEGRADASYSLDLPLHYNNNNTHISIPP